jgi:hypothetical protein
MSSLKDRTSARQTSPSGDGACSFIVGQNLKGAWIALETHGSLAGSSCRAMRHFITPNSKLAIGLGRCTSRHDHLS